jgi:hypothetical protein
MAIKTFTTGEVLTAADTNTYLANSGLVYVKSQTIGSAVPSVTVTDAFSATYDNYRIIVNAGVGSAIASLRLTLGATATGYYYGGKARDYSGADLNVQGSNVAFWYSAETDSNGLTGTIELQNPQLAKRTLFNTTITAPRTSGYWLAVGGFLDNDTQYTAFTLTFSGGTQTGGTVSVYGYRKA